MKPAYLSALRSGNAYSCQVEGICGSASECLHLQRTKQSRVRARSISRSFAEMVDLYAGIEGKKYALERKERSQRYRIERLAGFQHGDNKNYSIELR